MHEREPNVVGAIRVTGPIDPGFGRQVAELRRARRMSQLVLAADMNCSVRSIQQIEYGRISPPLRVAQRLARVLGVQFQYNFVEAAEDANGQRRPATSAARQPIDGDSVREGLSRIHRVGARE
jgi:transcriptional regulator with XRE-family HTH domain